MPFGAPAFVPLRMSLLGMAARCARTVVRHAICCAGARVSPSSWAVRPGWRSRAPLLGGCAGLLASRCPGWGPPRSASVLLCVGPPPCACSPGFGRLARLSLCMCALPLCAFFRTTRRAQALASDQAARFPVRPPSHSFSSVAPHQKPLATQAQRAQAKLSPMAAEKKDGVVRLVLGGRAWTLNLGLAGCRARGK